MKYLLEIIVVIIFVLICYFCFKVSKDYKHTNHKMDSLENEFIMQQKKFDSLGSSETLIIEKQKTINNYYSNEAIKIIHLPDSDNFLLLQSNLDRFSYLHNAQASKDSQPYSK